MHATAHQSHLRDLHAKKKFGGRHNSLARVLPSRGVCRADIQRVFCYEARSDGASRTSAKLSAIYNEIRFCNDALLKERVKERNHGRIE